MAKPANEKGQSSRESVVETIKQEHRALGSVVSVVQRVLQAIAAEKAEPDFALLSAALYYIDDFPERFHHPKEDEFLFKAIRGHAAEFDAILDELQNEHVRSAQMVRDMHRALVRYIAGAYGSLQLLIDCVGAYALMLSDHMKKEEELLTRVNGHLEEPEWRDIANAFASNEDPLAGYRIRTEFRKLRRRIEDLMPDSLRIRAR